MENLIYYISSIVLYVALLVFGLAYVIVSFFSKKEKTKQIQVQKIETLANVDLKKTYKENMGIVVSDEEKLEYKKELRRYYVAIFINFPIFVFSLCVGICFATEDVKKVIILVALLALALNIFKIYWLRRLEWHANLQKSTKYLNVINLGAWFVFFTMLLPALESSTLLDPSAYTIYLPFFVVIYILNFMSFFMMLSSEC